MSNDSDAEFEAMLEEAAEESQNGSDSNPATPAPATPKGGGKSKKGGAGAKGGKGARGGGSKGGKPKKGADDGEGYDTDHQDYCEVCYYCN